MYYDSDLNWLVLNSWFITSDTGPTFLTGLWVSEDLAPYLVSVAKSENADYDTEYIGYGYVDPEYFSKYVPFSFVEYEGYDQYADEQSVAGTVALTLYLLDIILSTEFSDGYSSADLGFITPY